MKFNVELDMDNFTWGEEAFSEEDFQKGLKNAVEKEIANQLIEKYVSGYNTDENVKDIIKGTINSHLDEIIKTIVSKVSTSIEHKKTIAEITPKASVLAAVNKENEDYFNTQIEKCIAKKFK